MSVSQAPGLTIKTRLLAVPASEYQRLVPHLELVESRDQVLYAEGELIRHVYFLNESLVSLISIMENGTIVEVGLAALEGMVLMPESVQNSDKIRVYYLDSKL